MAAIYKRELRSYFTSTIGWLYLAVSMFFTGLYFFVYNILYGYPQVGYVYQTILFLYVITVPVLTMRIFSEEKKNKTDQMLYTAPVSLTSVVLGKYFAAATVSAIPGICTMLYPVFLSFYGDISFSESYVPLLGYLLNLLAAVSIGVFISALFENQIISAIAGIGVLFITYIIGAFRRIIRVDWLADGMGAFDLTEKFDYFAGSQLSLEGTLYYLTVIILMLFLTVQVIDRRRWTFNKRNRKRGLTKTGITAIVIACIIAANIGITYVPDKYTNLDMTGNKIFEITASTEELLSGLNEDVTIYVLADEKNEDATVGRTLAQYDDYDRVTVEYVDPNKNPTFAAGYGDEGLEANSCIVVCGEKYKTVPYSDMYIQTINYDTYQYDTTGYDAEGAITSAIYLVTTDDIPVVYNITGNDEVEMGSKFRSAVERENIELKDLNILTADEIPSDAAAIMLLAPGTDLNERSAEIILDYLISGGHAYILTRYTGSEMKNLDGILSYYGVIREDGLVFETDRSAYAQYPYEIITTIQSTSTADSMTGLYIMSYGPEGYTVSDDIRDMTSVEVIASTSEKAVLKTDPEHMTSAGFEEGDKEGSFSLGVWITETPGIGEIDSDGSTASKSDASYRSEETRIAAFPTDTMVIDEIDATVSGTNLSLFTELMGRLVDHDVKVSVPSKPFSSEVITVSSMHMILWGVGLILFVPLILIITGAAVWIARRRK